jgi:hypothetical protein
VIFVIELQKNEMYKIEPLCRGMDDVNIWSCIQGHMGRAWVDDADKPRFAKIIIADFCYLLGCTGTVNEARDIVTQLANDCKGKLLVIKDEMMGGYIAAAAGC